MEDYSDILSAISATGIEKQLLFSNAAKKRTEYCKKEVYLRGLIELSNICSKDCYYCGIRNNNKAAKRYNLTDKEIMEAAKFAHDNNYGSLAIQSGEVVSNNFTNRVEHLLHEIHNRFGNEIGITLSLGEQSEDTYRRWFNAGAHRYLLRIETSSPTIYSKLHPNDSLHSFTNRINSLNTLKKIGYQLGTGVMIGLPFQTKKDLANDILFMKDLDIDMCGMGPYIEHKNTPLYTRKSNFTLKERLELTFNMIATLRLVMPYINIAATTALQVIDDKGREKALSIGANVIMPNLTPVNNKGSYNLYNNKPGGGDSVFQADSTINDKLKNAGFTIAYGKRGDSKHYKNKTN